MKLLVISDSHRNISRMLYAAGQTKPDVIIHLGDHISDAIELQQQFPEAIYHMVKGNCDMWSAGETEYSIVFDNVRVFITHGHKYGVKNGLNALIDCARGNDAALALYGHTHQALIRQIPGLWLLNPGQMARHDGSAPASYGIVEIRNGKFDCGIEYLPI